MTFHTEIHHHVVCLASLDLSKKRGPSKERGQRCDVHCLRRRIVPQCTSLQELKGKHKTISPNVSILSMWLETWARISSQQFWIPKLLWPSHLGPVYITFPAVWKYESSDFSKAPSVRDFLSWWMRSVRHLLEWLFAVSQITRCF